MGVLWGVPCGFLVGCPWGIPHVAPRGVPRGVPTGYSQGYIHRVVVNTNLGTPKSYEHPTSGRPWEGLGGKVGMCVS